MIKELSNISEHSIIDQGTDLEITSFSTVKYNSNKIGGGAFGEVFELVEIDDNPVNNLLVKVYLEEQSSAHALETISLFHDKIKREFSSKKQSIYQLYPGLLGFPFSVFRAKDNLENKSVVVLILFDLRKHGYFEVNQENTTSISTTELELENKFLVAHQFSKTINFLHRKQFIHSDIDYDALWYNPGRKIFALIDYDSGYNYSAQQKATTLGKINHLASVFARKIIQIGTGQEQVTDEDRIAEENWKVASALFEILFDVPPFFFLKDSEELTFKRYIKKNNWPNINEIDEAYINTNNLPAYEETIHSIKELEDLGFDNIIQLFRKCFNEGARSLKKRPEASDWNSAFQNVTKALELYPSVERFESDKTEIKKKNEAVVFSFEGSAFDYVEINGKVLPLFQYSKQINVPDTALIKLRAVSDIGVTEQEIEITANKVDPEFSKFTISEGIRRSSDPVSISWQASNAAKVEVQGFTEDYPSNGQILVHPTKRTTYVFQAMGFFDQIVEKTVTIDVIQPKIKEFDWKIDINKGINNVSIWWKTEFAVDCKLQPMIGGVEADGYTDVKINSKTEFELIAIGLYGQATRKIEAVPFNAPIVENIFVPVPAIEITTHVDTQPLDFKAEMPAALVNQSHSQIEFNFHTHINQVDIDFNKDLPEFSYTNEALIPDLRTHWFDKSYQKIKSKFLKSLSKLNLY